MSATRLAGGPPAPSALSDPPAELWDRWVCGRADAELLQLSGWGQLKARFGWRVRRVALAGAAEMPAAGVQLLLRRAYGLTLAYAPRGPLVDWRDAGRVEALLTGLRQAARAEGAALLKVEPALADTAEHRALLAGYGFEPSRQTIQPSSTIVLDLRDSPAALLDRMKSKWRYNVRLAERKDVTVRAMTAADLPAFHQIMQNTGQRDGFGVHSADYFAAAFDLLTPAHAVFLLAEYAGEPLAAIVVGLAGPAAWYLWGASSDRERSRMPNHALQWAGMLWAKEQGAQSYDLWGIPDPVGQLAAALRGGDGSGVPADEVPLDLDQLPAGGLWGVYRFKQGFGGQIVRYVGAWDLPVDNIGYRIYSAGLAVRAQAAELRRRWDGDTEPEAPAAIQGDERAAATERPIGSPAEWRRLLAELPDPHVLQSWEWGEVKGLAGWHAERVALTTPAGPAACQFLWREPLPSVHLRVAYVPKGPTLDWTNLDLVDTVLAAVEARARQRGCIFVKIDPDVPEATSTGRLVLHALERRGWHYSADQVQFKNTALTDLTVSEEALLAGMKSKWRYNVRLAERRGIRVREGSETDLATFYALYAETGARDGFLIRPYDYYRAAWEIMQRAQAEAGNPAGGALLLAEHADDSRPVAGLFLFRYGQRAWYFYGASSDRHRRDMPNYLLQWEALRWAMGQRCTAYDWWGAPTAIDDPADSMQGVWQFKQGFGAQFQQNIGAWDYVVSPNQYRLYAQAVPAVLDIMRRRRRGSSPAPAGSDPAPED